MCKVQAHNGIAWFEKCLIHCGIGIGLRNAAVHIHAHIRIILLLFQLPDSPECPHLRIRRNISFPDNLLHTYWSVRFPLPASLPGLQYFQMRSAPDFFSDLPSSNASASPNFFVTFCDVVCYIFDSVHLFYLLLRICLLFAPIPHFEHLKSRQKILFQKCFCLPPVLLPLKDYFFGTILIVLQSVVRIRSILPESFCMPLRLLRCMVSLLPSTHFIKIIRSTSHLCTLYIGISQIHLSTMQLA